MDLLKFCSVCGSSFQSELKRFNNSKFYCSEECLEELKTRQEEIDRVKLLLEQEEK